MPKAWRNVPGIKLQKVLNILKWTKNPGHHFRLSDKKPNPNPNHPNEFAPFGEFFKDGHCRDKFGNPVPLQSNAAHISLDEINDTFLDWFFQ